MKTLLKWSAALLLAFTSPAMAFISPPPSRPTPPPGFTYTWVAPVYRTVMDRTWIPGHSEWVSDWMQTSPGHWEQILRQVTTPGYWQSISRQVLVSQGYWQLVRLDPPPYFPPPPVIVPHPIANPPTVGVEGYAPVQDFEDLSRFSPLREWPSNK